MYIVRLILSLGLLFSGTVVGLHLSRRLIRRREILTAFCELMTRASIRIRYTAGDLCEVFSDNFVDYQFTYDAPFDEQWHSFIASFQPTLAAEDIAMLNGFTDGLGSADAEAQQKHIAMVARLIEEHRLRACEDIEKKAKLCRILPVSLSFALALLLI